MKKRSFSCSKRRKTGLYSLIAALGFAFMIYFSESRRNASPAVQMQTRFIPFLSETGIAVYAVWSVLLLVAGVLLIVFTHKWDGCKCKRCGKIRDKHHDWGACSCKHCGALRNEHEWEGCTCKRCGETRDKQHSWDGCKCKRCGKTRDEQHDWDGCVCTLCGAKRDAEHDFDGCKCKRCGEKRDEQHDWDGCKCKRCGKTHDVQHDSDGCKCKRCGEVVHAWFETSCEEVYIEGNWNSPSGGYTTISKYECARCGAVL